MYSYEKRIKAVKQLIQFDLCYADTVNFLGYPSPRELRRWYEEYVANGDLSHTRKNNSRYTEEDKRKAVDYYLQHGKNISRTVRKLGYPSRMLLDNWIKELAPEQKKHRCSTGRSGVIYTEEQKEQAVIELCSRSCTATELAQQYGVTRYALYDWKRRLLGKESEYPMPKKTIQSVITNEKVEENIDKLESEKAVLEQKVQELEKQVYRLQLEKDILEKAAEVIKKDQSVNISTLTNREKAIVINALRNQYQLKELLDILQMAKSSYCYQAIALKTDKYEQLRIEVRKIFDDAKGRYGYRRIHAVLAARNIIVSEKVIRRIMQEEQLIIQSIKRRKYSSYQGEISPAVNNIIERDFHAERPNEKWLTDITEFHIPAGKVYLSPIIDCFDGLPVSWSIGTSPNAELVNTMLDEAIGTLADGEAPIVHSDRGCHYRWPGWIDRMNAAGLTRSMSKKGCSPDNSACEGFFGRLKNEMFYGISWTGVSIEQFIKEVDSYLQWYANDRIKLSLGGMSPINYRKSLGIAV